jgi:hypothetical protein
MSTTPTTTDKADSTGISGTTDSHPETEPPVSNSTKTEAEVHSLENQAKTMLATDRKTGHEHSTVERQAACQAHQAEINTHVSNSSAAAERHLTAFEGILTKVQSYYTSKNLSVASYASLLAMAQSKQADAQAAVDALKALNVTIDCTQPDPAQSVAAVKTAVDNARTALQAYREAIKNLIVVIEGASSAHESTSTTGGNQ